MGEGARLCTQLQASILCCDMCLQLLVNSEAFATRLPTVRLPVLPVLFTFSVGNMVVRMWTVSFCSLMRSAHFKSAVQLADIGVLRVYVSL